jgi:hypothetical protein
MNHTDGVESPKTLRKYHKNCCVVFQVEPTTERLIPVMRVLPVAGMMYRVRRAA